MRSTTRRGAEPSGVQRVVCRGMSTAPDAVPPYLAFVVTFPVLDLAATRDFYERDVGLRLERADAAGVVYRVGPALVGFRQQGDVGPDHGDLLLTLACPDVDAIYRRLRRLGVETERPPGAYERGGMTHFVAHDPDGYRLEIRLGGPTAAP